MVRKWKLGATGTALLATTFVVVACSSKSDDDASNGGSGGTGAKGGTGGTTGGSTSAGKGGATTGGTGGSTTGGTGGSTTGGTGGTAGTGTATGGGAGMGAAGMTSGFACPSPVAASCNYITNWGMFSNGTFGGGLYVYGDLKQDTTDTGEFHVTGTVTTYSGFGIYFNSCTDVSAYSNVTFTVSGSSANAQPVSLWYIIQQNSDEPVDTAGMKGDCTGKPGNPCQSPYTQFVVSDTPQTIAFTSLLGGATMAPAMTDGKFDPKQAIGMQWQFRPETAQAAGYAVDVKLDNLMFGTGTAGGGSGGASSGGASSGGASSGGASSGGAGASAGGMGGLGVAGALNDMVSQIECTASGMAGSGAGGASSGGASSGGASTGGASTGGASSGGATTGGQGGSMGGRNNGGRGGMTAGGGGRGNAGRGQGGA